ncbi:MAG: RelA/SpoT family protein [Prevotellaceae bacterium]|jgi:GTP pyrophosphokinase|nr:RelA/SpoT family protein [Prevotellaceae bacterium]
MNNSTTQQLNMEEDRHLIQKEFDELLAMCRHRSPNEDELRVIREAFDLANEAHRGIRRKSGEPYITHPIAVAKIVVGDIGLGYKSVSAALLHDVVEDTPYTVGDIRRLFGDKIAELVDGLTKIDNVAMSGSDQAANFKRILLTLNNDIRVVLIKLADRLHNMRTLASMPEHKRSKITGETMYVYVPLALRLGLYSIKTELENIWLQFTQPDEYRRIKTKLDETEHTRSNYIELFTQPINERLHRRGVYFELASRTKSVYSIWRKMRLKGVPFEEVYDLFAVRIVFDPWPDLSEVSQCYEIHSIISQIYKVIPGRTRNWATSPKANGYEALHETFMGPQGVAVEVQIRSRRMDDIAKRGVAAHWRYKANDSQESEIDKWLEQIRTVLENPDIDAAEFLDRMHVGLTSSDIYIFTPKGDSKLMPKGATVLDFAYHVHSGIGNRAIAGKVNHQLASLNQTLRNGDQVEIITAESQTPQREWLDIVVTPRARSLINDALKLDAKNRNQNGRELIEQHLHRLGIQPQMRVFRKLAQNYGVNNKEELFSKAAAGLLDLSVIEKKLKDNKESRSVTYWGITLKLPRIISGAPEPDAPDDDDDDDDKPEPAAAATPAPIDKKKPYILGENVIDKTLSFNIAECCKPIPGDDVIGFIDEDKVHVTVHKKNCDEAMRLAAQYGDRIIKASWSKQMQKSFLSRIEMRGIDRIGILRDLTDIITGRLSVNIRKLFIQSHDSIFEGYIDVYVHDRKDLEKLIAEVKATKGIVYVNRAEKITD